MSDNRLGDAGLAALLGAVHLTGLRVLRVAQNDITAAGGDAVGWGAIREDEETSCFVSYCPALDIYSAGRTRPEAKKGLQRAADMFIRLCSDRGILERVLNQKGFKVAVRGTPAGARATTGFITVSENEFDSEYDDLFKVDVPLHLIAAAEGTHAGNRTASTS